MKKFLIILFAVMFALLVSCKQNVDDQDDDDVGEKTPVEEYDRSAAIRAYRDEVIGEWIVVPSGGTAYGDDRDRIVFSETSVFYRGSSYSLDVDSDVWDEKSYNASHSKPVNNFTARVPGDACLLVVTPDGYTSVRQNSIFINRGGDSDELWIEAELFSRKGGGSGSGGDVSGAWRYNSETLTFNDGGTFSYSGTKGTAPSGGRWSTSGSVLTVSCTHSNPSIGDVEEEFDYSVEDGDMTLSLRGGNATSLVLNMFLGVVGKSVMLTQ